MLKRNLATIKDAYLNVSGSLGVNVYQLEYGIRTPIIGHSLNYLMKKAWEMGATHYQRIDLNGVTMHEGEIPLAYRS